MAGASPDGDKNRDDISVAGTVHFLPIEGGCWTVRGDDKVFYDPGGGLPTEFQEEGLRVRLVARVRRDRRSIRMTGPIVEIVSIQRTQ